MLPVWSPTLVPLTGPLAYHSTEEGNDDWIIRTLSAGYWWKGRKGVPEKTQVHWAIRGRRVRVGAELNIGPAQSREVN